MSKTLLSHEREALMAKLRVSISRGKIAHAASNLFTRAGVRLIEEKVAMLLEAGLPKEEAERMGGKF